ncbi:IWS1-like protein, putative [Plasmodium berghei]|uniref:IWS1-like protein, putative n=2 Tax=Plasmodium berghei TaxID=5821 RepID=A0A509AM70_PLABA|nr:IWS1-like protein, putative [Plasmodium berghei ANKA]CXI46057.1 IWS1-like protein, putative [Plasmodium berghei]SCM22745.1 IWS1-like protein, putative [Plasmodium berghei]SCN25649.1 IWS1-like protein, putative [Plasmodium berghei]SCO60582.1 IWS1-like protein, putative [Plasmodium berghei]SCO62324.1 IWS1-like protein, putative [Plasmodium berghei]|eukprot:XP_034421741.1 IWS1-like protein, putative [Plasmodium berghei ANKA]
MKANDNKDIEGLLNDSNLFDEKNPSKENNVESFKKKMKAMMKPPSKKKRKTNESSNSQKENDDGEGGQENLNENENMNDSNKIRKKRKKSIKLKKLNNDDDQSEQSNNDENNEENKEDEQNEQNKSSVQSKDDIFGDDDENIEEEDNGNHKLQKNDKSKKKNKKLLKKNTLIYSEAEEGEEESDNDSDDFDDFENEDLINDNNITKNKSNKRMRDELGIVEYDAENGDDTIDMNKMEKKQKTHFDEILENLKSKRKKVQKISEDDGLQYCENVLNQMILMHEQDIQNVKEKKPATAKLQIIDEVCKILTKPKWKPFFMKLNIYHVLALWLMPLPKNTLPNFTIRTNLLKVIQQLPITIKSLRGSQLGKIMTFLHTHKDETDENKKIIRNILQNWMGPIIGINANYKQFAKERQKRILENPEYHKKLLEKAKTLIPDSISIEKEEEQNELKRHASIPYNSECSFLINVPSSIPDINKKVLQKSRIKKLADNMRLLKRVTKSQKVSIEGKGVAAAP